MMSQSRFCLSWDAFKKNICNGLSTLQQNGEFVDMTLAADGHLVKVHQLIMALASPYIKELIASAQCPHPIIFLNKISYTTLCSILEYIYTGEVLVSVENLNELIEAGRELHIKGLEDMKLHQNLSNQQSNRQSQSIQSNSADDANDEICYFEISNPTTENEKYCLYQTQSEDYEKDVENVNETMEDTYDETIQEDNDNDSTITTMFQDPVYKSYDVKNEDSMSVMQYTVSNRGRLQMILNRFLYYLKHTNLNSTRQWRCVDYLTNVKCPAHVVTKGDVVIQRISAHTHPFHDYKIMKKVQLGAIYSAIQEAEHEGNKKKNKTAVATNDGNSVDIE